MFKDDRNFRHLTGHHSINWTPPAWLRGNLTTESSRNGLFWLWYIAGITAAWLLAMLPVPPKLKPFKPSWSNNDSIQTIAGKSVGTLQCNAVFASVGSAPRALVHSHVKQRQLHCDFLLQGVLIPPSPSNISTLGYALEIVTCPQ